MVSLQWDLRHSREEAAAAQGSITAPSPPLISQQVISFTAELKARHLSTSFKNSSL